jgi:hypothetical protein
MNAPLRLAVRANIRASADHLRHGSELLEQLIRNDGLLVVDFFDGKTTEWRVGGCV